MAEALAAVGTAASVIQLADASIRVCLGLYGVFSALQSAPNEFQRHVIVVKDVHDALQWVRKTVSTGRLTDSEKVVLHSQLNNITDELSTLEKITVGKDQNKLSVKLGWILKSKETNQILGRLESHKTSLMLLLQSLTLNQSNQILQLQSSYQGQLDSLQSLIEKQSNEGAFMTSTLRGDLDDLAARMETNFQLQKEVLSERISTITSDHQTSVPYDQLETVLRNLLESHIRPYVEESLERRSESLKDAALKHIKTAIDNSACRIMEHVDKHASASTSKHSNSTSNTNIGKEEPNKDITAAHWEISQASNAASPFHFQANTEYPTVPAGHKPSRSKPRHTSQWSYQVSIPRIGMLRVEYRVYAHPGGRSFTLKIDLWPSILVLNQRSISLKYSNRSDHQGFMAICPSVASHPIVPNDNPIWELIINDDVNGILKRFQDGCNGPFDQCSNGNTLIKEASWCRSYGVVQLLLHQGADPTQRNRWGENSLDDLIYDQLYEAVVRPFVLANNESDSKLIHDSSPSFLDVFWSLVAAGCEPEDSVASVHDPLQDLTPHLSSWFLGTGSAVESQKILDETLGGLNTDSADYGSSEESHRDVDGFSVNEACYLDNIRQISDFLMRQGLDILQKDFSGWGLEQSLFFPNNMTLQVLRECGLENSYHCIGATKLNSALSLVLFNFKKSTLNLNNKLGLDNQFDVCLDNLVSLVSNGVDIHETVKVPNGWASVEEDGMMSPTALAELFDVLPEWIYALTRAGYDAEEVLLEDERRRREFRRLHGANSSAVDFLEDVSSCSMRRRIV